MKIPINRRIAFQIEKALIASHPDATFIRVNARGELGFDAEVEENGTLVDVRSELTAIVHRMMKQPAR